MKAGREAKTLVTGWSLMCVCAGFLVYMQLGTSLMIHANIQPYIIRTFFNETSTLKGNNGFAFTYGVWCLTMIFMLLGLQLGKKLMLKGNCCFEFSPKLLVFVCCLLQTSSLVVVSLALKGTEEGVISPTAGLAVFVSNFGAINGLLAGIAYQAPLLAT